MPIESTDSSSVAIQQLQQRLSKFETEAGRLDGLALEPLPTDVAISTAAKAGTTWMQQICHQLRSGGDMDFDEISRVVPWIELAADQGQRLRAEQKFSPRCFKTHLWAPHCPDFKRTIVVFRDPYDVANSFYRFFEGWFFAPGSMEADTFVREFWLARGPAESKMQNASYFHHLTSWYERYQEDRNKVLVVFFEDLKDDLSKQVARVADFLSTDDLDLRPNIDTAVRMASYEFMKEHQGHFDEKLSKLARNEACGLDKNAGMGGGKIRDGKKGGGKRQLSDAVRSEIDAKWKQVVQPVTGCATYEEFRRVLTRTFE